MERVGGWVCVEEPPDSRGTGDWTHRILNFLYAWSLQGPSRANSNAETITTSFRDLQHNQNIPHPLR